LPCSRRSAIILAALPSSMIMLRWFTAFFLGGGKGLGLAVGF
jgi:hypothetical protein